MNREPDDAGADRVQAPPSLRPFDLRASLLALGLAALWGSNPVAIKIGLADAPPIRLACLRLVVGGVAVLAWAAVSGQLPALRIARHEWRPLLVLGVLFTAQVGLLNIGTNLTTASHASILLNSYAVHTVVLAHFLIPGDHLTGRKTAGILVAYGGTVILFARQWTAAAGTLRGDVIVALAAILLAERTIYLARAVQRLDAVKLLLAQAVVGTAAFVLLTSVVEHALPTRWTLSLGLAVLYQGGVIAGFNYIANLWLLKHYRPSSLASYLLTTPIFGMFSAAWLMGDRLTPELLVACLLVAAGIGLTARWAAV